MHKPFFLSTLYLMRMTISCASVCAVDNRTFLWSSSAVSAASKQSSDWTIILESENKTYRLACPPERESLAVAVWVFLWLLPIWVRLGACRQQWSPTNCDFLNNGFCQRWWKQASKKNQRHLLRNSNSRNSPGVARLHSLITWDWTKKKCCRTRKYKFHLHQPSSTPW